MQPAAAKPASRQPNGAGALAGDVARTVVSLARRLHRSLAPPLRRRGVAPELAYAAIGIAAAIVIAAIVLTLSSGGSDKSRSTAARSGVPAPAPASAPLSRQLRQLDRIVTRSARP